MMMKTDHLEEAEVIEEEAAEVVDLTEVEKEDKEGMETIT